MAQGLFGGDTDYSHQAIKDIDQDIELWLKYLQKIQDLHIKVYKDLAATGYWNKIPFEVQGLFEYANKFFQSAYEDLSEIKTGINHKVEQHHITLLRSLSKTSVALNLKYGHVWHRDFSNKQYGQLDFNQLEILYIEGRSTAVTLLDASNIAIRLKDYLGRKGSQAKVEERTRLREILVERFSEDDLKTICFDLGIDFENLQASGKSGKARELVLECDRRSRFSELSSLCRRLRPDVDI